MKTSCMYGKYGLLEHLCIFFSFLCTSVHLSCSLHRQREACCHKTYSKDTLSTCYVFQIFVFNVRSVRHSNQSARERKRVSFQGESKLCETF